MDRQETPKREKVSAQGTERKGKNEYIDNQFILLDDLVYAPLHALAHSNMQLQASVVEAIRSLGTVKQNGRDEVVHLDNMNIAYEHLKPEEQEGYSVENVQLKVPLLSIVPVNNLNVKRAEIGFSTEIKVMNESDDRYKVNARICSPEQRSTDYLPKVSYNMEVRSVSAMEGLLRVTDLLSANPVAKQLDTVSLSPEGAVRSEKYSQLTQMRDKLSVQEKKLSALYQKITDTIRSQEKLQELNGKQEQKKKYQFNKESYEKFQDDIMEEVMRLKEQILQMDIQLAKEEIR